MHFFENFNFEGFGGKIEILVTIIEISQAKIEVLVGKWRFLPILMFLQRIVQKWSFFESIQIFCKNGKKWVSCRK